MSSITVAITGASGSIYGIRLLEVLFEKGFSVNLIISCTGMAILNEELGLDWDGEREEVEKKISKYFKLSGKEIRYFPPDDLFAPIASGSYLEEKMVICPCSMGTLSRIANGNSGNLIERAADVFIKENKQLVIVPRETPLSQIHLRNMLRLSSLGISIVPAMPAFYHEPKNMNDLIDYVVGKALDVLGIENDLFKRWGTEVDI